MRVWLLSSDGTEIYDVNLVDYWSNVSLATCKCSLGNRYKIESGAVNEYFQMVNDTYYRLHAVYYNGLDDLKASFPDWKLYVLDDNSHCRFPAVIDDKDQQFYHNYKLFY